MHLKLNTQLRWILASFVIWIASSSSSQPRLTASDSLEMTEQVSLHLDTLGWYFRVPVSRFQIASAKLKLFPDLINCREEMRTITGQYINSIEQLNLLDKQKDSLIVNNEYLLQLDIDNTKRIKDYEKATKKRKIESWLTRTLLSAAGAYILFHEIQR